MKHIMKFFLFFLLLLLFLSACTSTHSSEEELFQYKNSYVGDHGAVGKIIGLLPQSEHYQGLALQTKQQPYGIIIEYGELEDGNDEETIRELVLYNASFLFALVQNADVVTFQFPDQEYIVTREELEKWYGENLRDITNEEELRILTQQHLENKSNVNQFFKQ